MATTDLPALTYTVSNVDLSASGGGADETIAFDITYSAELGDPTFNGFGNVAVDGGIAGQIDGSETLTATVSLNEGLTTYAGDIDVNLSEIQIGGVSGVDNWLYVTSQFVDFASSANNVYGFQGADDVDSVTIDPITPTTAVNIQRLNVNVDVSALPPTFASYFFGDANGDGTVNGADANLWRTNFGSTSGNWSQGDWNGDGAVNGADANLWRANFGSTADSADAVLQASALSADVVSNDNQADFIYDPTTGELKVVTDGEAGIWSINVLTDEDASSTNTPANWAFADAGDNVEWTDQSIGFFALSDDAEFVLGTFATGLTASDFGRVLYFTTSNTSDNFGVVEVVPEPGSLALLALGGFFMSRRRRG